MVRVAMGTVFGGYQTLVFDAPSYDVTEDGTLRVKDKDGVPVATFVRGAFAFVTTVVPDTVASK